MRSLLFLLAPLTFAVAQPLPIAHAHNDYEHDRPLIDALEQGFGSVEADIYLVRGKLIVSHLWPIFSFRTLQDLYLRPLDSIVRAHHGIVHQQSRGTFFLMIDLKSDGRVIYPILLELISHYPALFQTRDSVKAVTIFLSGDRPIDLVASDPFRRLSLDGRPADLGQQFSSSLMPIVSDNYTKWCDWNGKGKPGVGALSKIRELAIKVHAEGKLLRLWEIPDNPDCWGALIDAGVDLINSDRLEECSLYLRGL